MKTMVVSADDEKVVELLTLAQAGNVLLIGPDGEEYLLAALGEDDEFERTRNNEELMRLLDERRRSRTESDWMRSGESLACNTFQHATFAQGL